MLRNLSHALFNRTDCCFRSSRVPLYQIINYLSDPTPPTLKNGGSVPLYRIFAFEWTDEKIMLRNWDYALLKRTDCSFRSSRVPLH